jgi:hypothetical protein
MRTDDGWYRNDLVYLAAEALQHFDHTMEIGPPDRQIAPGILAPLPLTRADRIKALRFAQALPLEIDYDVEWDDLVQEARDVVADATDMGLLDDATLTAIATGWSYG